MLIREATPAEMTEVGDIRLAAYQAGGFISADSGYASTLRDLGADGKGHVLVAVQSADHQPAGGDCQRGGHGRGDGGRGEADPSTRATGAVPGQGECVVGTIMLQIWPHTGQVVAGPDEAEIRALAVRPHAQGQGIGAELLRRLVALAREKGVGHLVLCTEPGMRAAHHLYERAGFVRRPERDWSPLPDLVLLTYSMRLSGGAGE